MRDLNWYAWHLEQSPNYVPGLWGKSYHSGNSQMKTSETASTKTVNQEHYHIPWRGVAKTSTSIKYVKDAAMVAPIISPFNLILQPLRKSGASWRITVDYHNVSQHVS